MLKILKCFIIKTKYDDHGVKSQQHQYIQCNISIDNQDTSCQTDTMNMIDRATQYDMHAPAAHAERYVFLREKAIKDMPFALHGDGNDKYIVLKDDKVFLRHIKGYFKYDKPW
jgi:hypothetical protein